MQHTTQANGTQANGNGNGQAHRVWSAWPPREAFDRVRDQLDEAVLEMDRLHHRLAGEIVPPISVEQVSDLTAFGAWAALDLTILHAKLSELALIREQWQSWLVSPRSYYEPPA